MSSTYPTRGLVMYRLQSQLDDKMRAIVHLGQQIKHRLRQAIGTGGNVHSHRSGQRKRLFIQLAQARSRRISAGIILKIRNTEAALPFAAQRGDMLLILLSERTQVAPMSVRGERTVGAAADPDRAVDIPGR